LKTFLQVTGDNDTLIDEGLLRDVFTAISNFAKGVWKRFMEKVKGMDFGKQAAIKVKIPKNLSEAVGRGDAVGQQSGKPGGEYVEQVIIHDLYTEFRDKFHNVEINVDGTIMSFASWKQKEMETYRKTLLANPHGKKHFKEWDKVGRKGAQALINNLTSLYPKAALYEMQIESTGKSLTGIEKSDMILRFRKIDEEHFSENIKLSLKASLNEGGTFSGTQTGEEAIIFTLYYGMSPTEAQKKMGENPKDAFISMGMNPEIAEELVKTKGKLKDAGLLKLYNDLGMKTAEIEGFRDAMNELQIIQYGTKEQQEMDKEHPELPATFKSGTERRKKVLVAIQKEIQSRLGKKEAKTDPEWLKLQEKIDKLREDKKAWIEKWTSVASLNFVPVVMKALQTLQKKDEKLLIDRILKLSGMELGMDYLALGQKPVKIKGKKAGVEPAIAVNTLDHPQYRNKVNAIFESMKKTELTVVLSPKETGVVCSITDKVSGKSLVDVKIYKDSNNSRVGGFDLKSFVKEDE